MKSPSGNALLTRDEFREGTLLRDGHKCVICGRGLSDGVKLDAHHIMERRLWRGENEFGGYFLDNGSTLCDTGYEKTNNGDWSCHLKAGMTLLAPDTIRKACGIQKTLLPEHLYSDQIYTVWGDPVMGNGLRMRGELFNDESVQFMLKLGNVLDQYVWHVRHPRTYHLPYSPIVTAVQHNAELAKRWDDKVMKSLDRFQGQRVIVTVKMDGMQSTLYKDYMHARTPDFKSDVTWTWLQNFHKKFCYEIPEGWRLNVENLWGSAGTAIKYSHLPLYTMAWMLWNDKNECLSWDATVEWVSLFSEILKEAGVEKGLPLVPVLYDGIYDEDKIKSLYQPTFNGDEMEGFVVRLADGFHYRDFRWCVGKYVRSSHQVRHGGELIRNEIGI